MKKTISYMFLLIFAFLSTVNSQWYQPYHFYNYSGGELMKVGSKLICGGNSHNLLISDCERIKWEPKYNLPAGTYSISNYQQNLFALSDNYFNSIIYYSGNLGDSWVQLINSPSSIQSFTAKDSTVLVLTYSGLLLRSTNLGINWETLSTNLIQYSPNVLCYVGDKLLANTYSGVYESTDNGSSWTLQINGLRTFVKIVTDGRNYLALTDNGLSYLTPNSNQWLSFQSPVPNDYITDIALENNDIYVAAYDSGVYFTNSTGQNWSLLKNGLPSLLIVSIICNNGHVMVSTDNRGVYILSTDKSSWYSGNEGLYMNPYLTYSIKLKNEIMTATVGDGIYATTDKGSTWYCKNNGLEHSIVRALINPCGDTLIAGTLGGGVYFSPDAGANWFKRNTGLTDLKIMTLTNNGTDIYAGTNFAGIFKTTDCGNTWIQINSGVPNLTIPVIMSQNGIVYAGTNGSGMLRSVDNGTSWEMINNGIGTVIVKSLVGNGQYIYAGTSSSIFKSTDNGLNWTNSGTGLPDVIIWGLNEYQGIIYAGTDYEGVYTSVNTGLTWQSANDGFWIFGYTLPHVKSFVFENDDVFVSTYGVGFLTGKIKTIVSVESDSENPSPTEFSLAQNYPNPFNPSTTISFSLPTMQNVLLKVYDVLGKEVATLVNEDLQSGTYTREFNASNLASGMYIYSLKAGNYSETKKMLLMK